MSLSICHKNLFVLDRSTPFSRLSNHQIEYDVMLKLKTPGIIPAAPITKTLWTCNVECMMEYIRIIYDLFPSKSLIRVITGSKTLNTWAAKDQNIHQLMLGLAHIGPPKPEQSDDEYDVMHGLSKAIESLCEPTETQNNVRTTYADLADCVDNKGRIICFTVIKSEAHVRMLEECVLDALIQHNKLAERSDTTAAMDLVIRLMQIDHCELVLMHIVPVGEELKISDKPLKQVSPLLSSQVIATQSGRFLYNNLVALCQKQFNLSSTTVTGIPMKEEQNASSSANYDVELLHPAATHEELIKCSKKPSLQSHLEGLLIPSKEGLPTSTVTLKWCTPKSNVIELHQCIECYRITPVDVNSRPSSCLTNFLLGGRAVMLEQPRKTGTKVISHMLACHGGEIFIHTIPTARAILEDPPSISEGAGGRVTDYRINDFGEFMKENRLAPSTTDMVNPAEAPIQTALKRIGKTSRFWPMTISETVIFNMTSHIDPLQTLVLKDTMSEDEMLECKKAIYHVVGMESRNEPLPLPVVGSRGKGPKREEQYRQMWSELESFIRAHADTSPNHQKVLECILECRKPLDEPKGKKGDKTVIKEEKLEKDESDKSWKEFDRYQKMTERERQDLSIKTEKSGEGSAKKFKMETEEPVMKMTGQNLLSIWTNRIKTVHSKRHVEFVGRTESVENKTELYKHLNLEIDMDVSDVPTTKR